MNLMKIAILCIRYFWAFPVSFFGILLLPLVILSGGSIVIVAGVIEAECVIASFLLRRLHVSAITIGHVVFGRNRDSLVRLRNHELVHVRQYERWGPLFPFLYLLSSAAAVVRGRDPYRDNRFEQKAFRVAGPPDTTGPQDI